MASATIDSINDPVDCFFPEILYLYFEIIILKGKHQGNFKNGK